MVPPERFVDVEEHGGGIDPQEQDCFRNQLDPGLGLQLESVQDEGDDEVPELQEELGRQVQEDEDGKGQLEQDVCASRAKKKGTKKKILVESSPAPRKT